MSLLDNFFIKEGFLLEVKTPKYKETLAQKSFLALSNITTGIATLSIDSKAREEILKDFEDEELTTEYLDAVDKLKKIIEKLPTKEKEKLLDENGDVIYFKTIFKLKKRLTTDELDEIFDLCSLDVNKIFDDKRYKKTISNIFEYFEEIIIDDIEYNVVSVFGIKEKFRLISHFKFFLSYKLQELKKK